MNITTRRFSAPLVRFPALSHPFYACVLGVAVGIFLLLTMKSGTEWEGDDALYILNARNIVLGLPYAQTGYIVNPDNPIHPAAYPPGFPLLLAPIYWLFGVSLVKMKALCIVCFAVFIAVFARIAQNYVTPGLALATAAAVGLHPYIWGFKDSLYSELPFMLVCYAALLLIDRVQGESVRTNPHRFAWIAGAAALVAFAYLIRAIGIVIFPAALLSAVMIWRHRLDARRTIGITLTVLACAALIIVIVQRIFPADIGTYLGYFRDSGLHALHMAALRYWGVRGVIIGSTVFSRHHHLATFLEAALTILAVTGFAVHVVLRRVSVFETFFIGCLLFLIIYPVTIERDRYSLPIWPLAFLYCAVGFSVALRMVSRKVQHALAFGLGVVVIGCYVVQYSTAFAEPVLYPVESPRCQELFAAIRAQVPTDAVILARKPTTIALFTERSATIWALGADDAHLWDYIRRTHVGYILQERFPVIEFKANSNALLQGFVERNRTALMPVFSNEWYILYRIARPRAPQA